MKSHTAESGRSGSVSLMGMQKAYAPEQEQEATLVAENLVHQAHGPPDHHLKDEKGKEQDGFGRSSGNGMKINKVYAI